jgi:hypothetical protein
MGVTCNKQKPNKQKQVSRLSISPYVQFQASTSDS